MYSRRMTYNTGSDKRLKKNIAGRRHFFFFCFSLVFTSGDEVSGSVVLTLPRARPSSQLVHVGIKRRYKVHFNTTLSLSREGGKRCLLMEIGECIVIKLLVYTKN